MASIAVRNRNKEIRKVRVGDLWDNPANHRMHGDQQKAVMADVLKEIGYLGTAIAFEMEGGGYRLLDGHCRKNLLNPDEEIDVCIVDLDPEERRKVLATHDAIGAMAGVDHARLDALIAGIQIDSPAIVNMLAELTEKAAELANQTDADPSDLDEPEGSGDSEPASAYREQYGVIVICDDAAHQEAVYNQLEQLGMKCRVVVT